MTFTPETGSGAADANSYGAVADADSYHAARGNSAWAALITGVKQQNLVKATDYMDGRWSRRFIGTKLTTTQALAWPRADADPFAEDEIPIKLQYACFEYALRVNSAPLAPDIVVSDAGVPMMLTRMKAGPILQDFAPVFGSRVMVLRPYPGADMYLSGLVLPALSVIR